INFREIFIDNTFNVFLNISNTITLFKYNCHFYVNNLRHGSHCSKYMSDGNQACPHRVLIWVKRILHKIYQLLTRNIIILISDDRTNSSTSVPKRLNFETSHTRNSADPFAIMVYVATVTSG